MRILKNILFLFLCTQFSAICQTQYSNYAYEENFDTKNPWPQGENKKRALKTYNGRYYFEHKEKVNNWQISTSAYNLETTRDFEITTSIQKISGTDNSGISFLYDYKDIKNYKEFGFTTNGYFRIAESVNGTYKNEKKWTKSDNVKTGNYGVNELKIKKTGNSISFIINNKSLHTITYKGFVGNKISIIIYKNQKISIDYIKTKYLSKSITNSKKKVTKSLLFEGFNDNKNSWPITKNDEIELGVKDGNYIFNHKRENGGWSSTILKKINSERDFNIKAQIKKVSGINNNGFGLIFGRQDNNNQNEFFITSGGSYMIKNFENGKSKTIKEWTVSKHIKKGNSYNYLEVKHIDNTFEYYINNKLVYTNYAAKMYGDRLGFIVYNRQKISVGYLSVNYINKKVKSKISLEKDIVFLDEFNNNSNNWNELNNESVNFYFSDGNYYLNHKKDETGYLAYINKNFDSSKDFEIETKFKHISGDTNSPYGLLWGKKDENYLQILLTSTGYYKVKRVINNKNEEIIKWVKSSAINIGSGKSNILKVKKEGEYYKLFINSTYLTKIDFEAFFGSEIGYGIYYKQKIAIDYLKINQDKTNIIKPTKKEKTLTVPLYDSFNSNTNNWNLDNASDYSVAINNGKLNLKRKKSGGSFISRTIDINSYKDFIIETAINQKNASQDGMFGITFGRKNSSNEFSFLISSNGNYKFRKFLNNVNNDIIPYTYSSAIKTGSNEINKLKIVKSGQLLRFYINDIYINETPFQPFFGNKFGYTVYFEREIAVDYLDIKYQTTSYNNPPIVKITEPSVEVERGFKIVKSKRILVKGVATDVDGIYEITVNGTEANVAEDGTFSANVPLKYGKNELIVKATDLKQASSSKTFIIKRASSNSNPTPIVHEKLDIGFGKYYALIIGVSEYDDKTIPDLNGEPTKDAQNLANVLISNYTFNKENVTVLKNPTENQINREFIKLSRKINKNDNLVIFYAGHGNYDKKTEKGYWMPSNSNRDFEENIILNTSIVTYIKAIPSKHTLLISDACFSGSILTRTRSLSNASNAVKAKYALTSRKAITSGALETVPNKSVFMEYLIKKLKDNSREYLSAGQLFNMIEDPIIDNPRGDKTQRPIYAPISGTGNEGGDFILIRRN